MNLNFCFHAEELHIKKKLHDPDNHDGVIIHLETDVLECEFKWTLGSITTNKASGGDGIPVELFQILKDDVKVLHSICQRSWFGGAEFSQLLLVYKAFDFSFIFD